jgi:heterodisulfide reductase subunit A
MTTEKNNSILVIGAGLAGIEASLLLAKAGRKVYLVEKESYFGGAAIKSEEITPHMECATCMLAPKQSDILENKNIELLTLCEVIGVNGKAGHFAVKIRKRARYISLESCIGCGACFEPCPVSVPNDFEEGLSKRKAIYVACAGALPNAPVIDMENCLRNKGEDCTLCKEACMFDAICYEDKDEETTINVGAIIVATGYKLGDMSQFPKYGYNKKSNVYSAFEFERLRASNGPTSGTIQMRDGQKPKSIGLIHCVGRDEKKYCSQVCCMYLTKFAHYAFEQLENVKIYQFYKELSIPGKGSQKFFHEVKARGIEMLRNKSISISANGSNEAVTIEYQNEKDEKKALDVDMVVLAPFIEAYPGTDQLARLLEVKLDDFGFIKTDAFDSVTTTRAGIFAIGCIQSPMSMSDTTIQAHIAAGHVLAAIEE